MKLAVLVACAVLMGASKPPFSPYDKAEPSELPAAKQLDGMTTGGIVHSDRHKVWKEKRDSYRECPSCLAKQPFPGDAELPADNHFED